MSDINETDTTEGSAEQKLIQDIDNLSQKLLALIQETDPTFSVLFSALANIVVGFSLQYIHDDGPGLTPDALAGQLTRFISYASEIGAAKLHNIHELLPAEPEQGG